MAKPLAHVDTSTLDPFIIIGGKKYPLSGAVKNPGGWSYNVNNSNNYSGSMSLPMPYLPPEGFTFQTFALESSGFTHVSTNNIDRAGKKINCRVFQANSNSANALTLIGWRLVSVSTDPNRLQ